MAHLEFEEILEFVSIKEFNQENLDLIAKVGHHVAQCEQCDKMVSAVRNVYKEFEMLGRISQAEGNILTLADLGIDEAQFGNSEGKQVQFNG